MNTAFIKEIDGIKVILGVDFEKLDPIKTGQKIKPLIENSSEFKSKKARLEKIKVLTIANDSLFRQGRQIANRVALAKSKQLSELKPEDFSSNETNSLNGYNSKMIANNTEIESIKLDLVDIEKNLKAKISELQKENGVFFELTNPYEIKVTKETHADFSEKLKKIADKKMFLTPEGEIITDNRNKTFYGIIDSKWIKKEIKLLSEIVDSSFKLDEDLTDEEKEEIKVQFENDRIINLTDEEKEIEKNRLISNAMIESISLKSKLEIEGDSEALKKAQDFYNSEVLKIEEIYK